MNCLLITLLVCVWSMRLPQTVVGDFRTRLGTKSPYAYRRQIQGAPFIYSQPDPPGYIPVHLYLLSRHGTRWPTKDRALQITNLAKLFKDARAFDTYPWVQDWQPPLADIPFAAGELHPIGDDELWTLGQRLRARFPSLAHSPYFPKRYPIISTKVARTAQSASAFAQGFFPHTGRRLEANDSSVSRQSNITRPQPVAISMLPKRADPVLRFFDMCPAYQQHEDTMERWMAGFMDSIWAQMAPAIAQRLRLVRAMEPCEVDALWQLCQVEAGLQHRLSGGACALLAPQEVDTLEWLEDLRLYEAQGYGAKINYEIAAPLLADIARSLRQAAGSPGLPLQQARLMFAHCETLVPLATLMGLFRPGDSELREHKLGAHLEGEGPVETGLAGAPVSASEAAADFGAVDSLEDLPLKMLAEGKARGPVRYKGRELQALQPPPGWAPAVATDPNRTWRAGKIAPLGANLALVLYRSKAGQARAEEHLVRLVYNEQVVAAPGCGGKLDCPLEEFLEVVVGDRAGADKLGKVCGKVGGVEVLQQDLYEM